MNQTRLLRATVRSILEHADRYEWSLQGFGMLRTYLSKEVRLHVWDSRFVVPDVSTIHDHPWDFTSLIVSGTIRQRRFEELPLAGREAGLFLNRQTIRCGVGGGIVHACEMSAAETAKLVPLEMEEYHAGEWYSQRAEEIHQSLPVDGTVTLVDRTFRADTEHARVYYDTPEWVSAEPRIAMLSEVALAVNSALAKWEASA